jgi:mannosyltransferase
VHGDRCNDETCPFVLMKQPETLLTPRFVSISWMGWIMWVVILTVAAITRFFHIGVEPLWLDEGYSWWDAHQSLSDLWNLVPQCDPHPPLYFVALKSWINEFGDSSQALRALSATLGVATTGIVILAGREVDKRAGWLAGILFALTPFQVVYGREARPYALLCFGAALMVFGTLHIVRISRLQYPGHDQAHPIAKQAQSAVAMQSKWGWVALLVGGLIVLWSNNTAIFTVAAMLVACGIWLLRDTNSRWAMRLFIATGIVLIALWLPYLPTLLEQAVGVITDFWIPTPSGEYVAQTLSTLVSFGSRSALYGVLAVLLGGTLLMWRRGAWRESILLSCMVVIPIALNYAMSMTLKPIFLPRTLIAVTPAVVLLLAIAAILVESRWWRRSAVAVLIVTHGLAFYWWQLEVETSEPWDQIAQALTGKSPQIGNAIVLLTANELALPLSHAFEDLHVSIPVQGVPENFPSPGLHARYPSGKCAPSVRGQDLADVKHAIGNHRVVYFITRSNNVYDPNSRVTKFLQSIGFKQTGQLLFTPGALELHTFVASTGLDQLVAKPALSTARNPNRHY